MILAVNATVNRIVRSLGGRCLSMLVYDLDSRSGQEVKLKPFKS